MTNLAQRSVAVGLCAQVVLCVPVISANAAVPLIRLVEGMVVTENVAYHESSPEFILSLKHIGADGVQWESTSQLAGADAARSSSGYGSSAMDSADDLQSSHHLFMRFHTGEDAQVGATVMMASGEIFAQLRSSGETAIDVVEIPPDKGDVYNSDNPGMRRNFRGKLTRVAFEKMRILVNGVPVDLPALHARGLLKARDLVHTFDFWWLDDPTIRLLLRYRFEDFTDRRITRIDYPPTPGAGDGTVSATIAKSCRAEIPGIYFASGSAGLLTASLPALGSIAAMIKAHPEWTLTIEGHTDNIGSEQTNLLLSRDRAASVKTALTAQFGIAGARIKIEGFGRTRPVDSNDTVEGRSHNRRVEVSRVCAH